jgi:hypothetical protein
LNLLNTGQAWYTLVVLIILASIAKIVPVTLVSKLCSRRPWFYCLSIGVLMNTRGIVQLVVLNIGVELGVLSPKIFSIFVLMATILTFLTSPILSLLYRQKYDIQKLSAPNVAEDLRNIKGGEIDMDVINNNKDDIPTISNGDISNNEDKGNSIKLQRRSSTSMPPHDTYVTFNDQINYARTNSSGTNQNTEEFDVFDDIPTRPINMTRF